MTDRSAPSGERSYLTFVRAGAASLHGRLIAEDPSRNWDCCVSWYVPAADSAGAEYSSEGGDNKLEGFLEFWRRRSSPWRYRYVLLLDDDIYFRPGDISRLFELCERDQVYLAQPGLRWFTHTTLNVCVRNPVCELRRVSFVEVMAPCFASSALADLMPTFGMTKSTWGTDWAWGCLSEGKHALYVVDAIGIEHTRAGDRHGGAFYRKLRAMGVDPEEELRHVRHMFPDFVGAKTLPSGHVFRRGVPRLLAPVLLRLFEKLKFIVRLRKQVSRQLRLRRARAAEARDATQK